MKMKWTESEIQSLKAQEAKDLAIRLFNKLHDKQSAPISAGQVQLKELQYGLRIKEAEAEDKRRCEQHAQRIKELELQIEQERSQQAGAVDSADRVRQEHAQLVEQVEAAQESLSIQLERATCEHNARLESLEAEHAKRTQVLEEERERREEEKASLVETIQELMELSEIAQEVAELGEEVQSRKANQQKEIERLDEAFETAKFEKNKGINQIKRDQEVEIVELEAQHRMQVIQQNMEAATKTLSEAGMEAVADADLKEMQQRLQQQHDQDESALADLRRETEVELKKAYNITTSEVFDVTELYYREKSLAQEVSGTHEQMQKLETEVNRMRQHIEREPDRIARSVEAAKVQIQNNIEQAGKR